MISIAKLLGISRSTLYGVLPQLLLRLPPDFRPGPPSERYDALLDRTGR